VLGRGFQTIQRGVASRTERGSAGLRAKGLDALGLAMLAISDQRVDLSIGDPGVWALLVGTGETLGVYAFGSSSPAFHLAPGPHRKRQRSSTRRGNGGETASGAIVWAAGLEVTVEHGAHLGGCSRLGRALMGPAKSTKQREREQEEEHEQEHL
jgi:hypothetical protein